MFCWTKPCGIKLSHWKNAISVSLWASSSNARSIIILREIIPRTRKSHCCAQATISSMSRSQVYRDRTHRICRLWNDRWSASRLMNDELICELWNYEHAYLLRRASWADLVITIYIIDHYVQICSASWRIHALRQPPQSTFPRSTSLVMYSIQSGSADFTLIMSAPNLLLGQWFRMI